MIEILNEILAHERSHFNFYLQSLMTIKGMERIYIKPLLEKEMMGELEHIRAFGDKIVALGGIPSTEAKPFKSSGNTAKCILNDAIAMEREILDLYHKVYPLVEEQSSKDMSLLLLIEENIEHTTEDVEEMEKINYILPC